MTNLYTPIVIDTPGKDHRSPFPAEKNTHTHTCKEENSKLTSHYGKFGSQWAYSLSHSLRVKDLIPNLLKCNHIVRAAWISIYDHD